MEPAKPSFFIAFIFILIISQALIFKAFAEGVTFQEAKHLRNEVSGMFYHAFDGYMKHAFPRDELKPLSCEGEDTLGGYALTLIDSLDTLALLGDKERFSSSVEWISKNVRFDINKTVSLFETTIRILGGLLSAHLIASDYSTGMRVPSYDDELLHLAEDLARRLLPAFDTPTGIPFGSVNLLHGVDKNESKITSTAGGGTLTLEFGVLSRLTNDPIFEQVTKNSVRGIWACRSRINLVGAHIDVFTGEWTQKDAGIGTSIDSFYEYLLKAYLLFGDEEYLYIFQEAYGAAMHYLFHDPWYVEVNMNSAALVWPLFNSLQAFWPGLQVLAGDIDPAIRTHTAFFSVWKRYGFTPEGFNLASFAVQHGQKSYPLRPELIESTYWLYKATRDPRYLDVGRDIVSTCSTEPVALVDMSHMDVDKVVSLFAVWLVVHKVICIDKAVCVDQKGFCFGGEILWLLFDLAAGPDNLVENGPYKYIFSTEGHLFPMTPRISLVREHCSYFGAYCKDGDFRQNYPSSYVSKDGQEITNSSRFQRGLGSTSYVTQYGSQKSTSVSGIIKGVCPGLTHEQRYHFSYVGSPATVTEDEPTRQAQTTGATQAQPSVSNQEPPEVLETDQRNCQTLKTLKSAHALLVVNGLFDSSDIVVNKIIRLYFKFGSADNAHKVFDEIPQPNAFLWTSMIHGHVETKLYSQAFSLFLRMLSHSVAPLNFTVTTVLKGLAREAKLSHGEVVYGFGLKCGFDFDVMVQNSMLDLLMRCGKTDLARRLFDEMGEIRDIVSWNSMIFGYCNNGKIDVAREFSAGCRIGTSFLGPALYRDTLKSGEMTEARVLFNAMPSKTRLRGTLCFLVGNLESARRYFEAMPIRNVASWTMMIDGYMKSGNVNDAKILFDEMPEKNLVSWSTMIGGYAKNGEPRTALELLELFKKQRIKPDEAFILGVISACSQLGVLDAAESISRDFVGPCLFSNLQVATSLIDMYAKCGSLERATKVFEETPKKDLFCYSTMISAYANHGFGHEAISLFEKMTEKNLRPDSATFVGVLSACNHGGLIDEGWRYFKQMTDEYGIQPMDKHYACMVDLLGRGGRLNYAYDLIRCMKVTPTAAVWGSLLAACGVHRNVELAEAAAAELFKIDPDNSGNYVLLSNLYAALGQWHKVAKVRAMIRLNRVKKNRGSSWIELESVVHEFVMGDLSHLSADRINFILDLIHEEMKFEDKEWVLNKPLSVSLSHYQKALYSWPNKLFAISAIGSGSGETAKKWKAEEHPNFKAFVVTELYERKDMH
ncbi:hypothetical protein OSB04_029717 [Centaurea solstitialis]|uniref:alpha-1,2-Mannosidase n=1 Tax=Centaurea solstitialis TaxID=347529 RepID=A0AA38S5G4_9ASTR|nr:hypothetical protein OSB04_029717 [Centaurea solstitialis]